LVVNLVQFGAVAEDAVAVLGANLDTPASVTCVYEVAGLVHLKNGKDEEISKAADE